MAVGGFAGFPARRCIAYGAILSTILVVVPVILGVLAGGPDALTRPTGYSLSVSRAQPAAVPSVALTVSERKSTAALSELFREKGYAIDSVRSGESAVPRLVMAGLPRDLKDLDSSDDRKKLFVKTMLPLVLLVNESVERDRQRLLRLAALDRAGIALAPMDRVWVARVAARYGMEDPGKVKLTDLLKRVDVVPVSMALAQAAEESGWGTSRFAQKGNALFGQLTWSDQHSGIVPRNRRDGETHRFRSFDDLLESVRAYVHNLNTHDAYLGFRLTRAGLRDKGRPLDSLRLVASLEKYSERGPAYVEALRGLIRVNRLQDFDRAALGDGADLMLAAQPLAEPGEATAEAVPSDELPAPARSDARDDGAVRPRDR